MFGIVEQPCARQTADRREWMSHLCGLCLTLRDNHGQLSRVTTNRDTVLLSALYEAQVGEVERRRAGPCPLRHFKGADVVAATTTGVRFASAVTLLLASVAVDDKVVDGEIGPPLVGRTAARMAGRWRRDALADAAELGFDGNEILAIVAEQADLEARRGLAVLGYSAPTERAVAAAFRHTAVLAGKPGNADGLEAAGRMFGRIAYVLDAWEDREPDARNGRFNAFEAASPEADGEQLFQHAHARLRRHVDGLDLPRPGLVQYLLRDGVHKAGRKVFAQKHDRNGRPPTWLTALLGGWAASVGACGVCVVCIKGIEDACEKACEDACDDACDDACSGCDCNCDSSACNCDCNC